MILFAAYAVLVWWVALRWRRTWRGVGVVVSGAGLAFLVSPLLARVDGWLGGGLWPAAVQILVVAEAALILVVGLFIVSLRGAPRGRHCGYCWYDLTGLPEDVAGELKCPECGTPGRGFGKMRENGVLPVRKGGGVPRGVGAGVRADGGTAANENAPGAGAGGAKGA